MEYKWADSCYITLGYLFFYNFMTNTILGLILVSPLMITCVFLFLLFTDKEISVKTSQIIEIITFSILFTLTILGIYLLLGGKL